MIILDQSSVASKRFIMEFWTNLWTWGEEYGLYPALPHTFNLAHAYMEDSEDFSSFRTESLSF